MKYYKRARSYFPYDTRGEYKTYNNKRPYYTPVADTRNPRQDLSACLTFMSSLRLPWIQAYVTWNDIVRHYGRQ